MWHVSERGRVRIGVWSVNLREIGHFEILVVAVRIILKCSFKE
jgi:hypothetical protein